MHVRHLNFHAEEKTVEHALQPHPCIQVKNMVHAFPKGGPTLHCTEFLKHVPLQAPFQVHSSNRFVLAEVETNDL